jgi:hypothetical protein
VEFHPLKSSAFRGALLQQLSLSALFYNRRGRRRMHPNRWLLAIFLLLSIISLAGRVHAAEEIVELRLQRAKCLCGIVTYVNGDPVPDAQVEELGQDWKGSQLRSTKTDSEGRFTLASIKGRKIYYLQISSRQPGVNPLRVPVQISRFRGTKLLRLQLRLA